MNTINNDVFFQRNSDLNHNSDVRKDSSIGSFGDFLKESINEVNGLQKKANTAVQNLATGKEADIHNTMIAMQKASVSFDLIVQIQSKLMTAYDELKRMQI